MIDLTDLLIFAALNATVYGIGFYRGRLWERNNDN